VVVVSPPPSAGTYNVAFSGAYINPPYAVQIKTPNLSGQVGAISAGSYLMYDITLYMGTTCANNSCTASQPAIDLIWYYMPSTSTVPPNTSFYLQIDQYYTGGGSYYGAIKSYTDNWQSHTINLVFDNNYLTVSIDGTNIVNTNMVKAAGPLVAATVAGALIAGSTPTGLPSNLDYPVDIEVQPLPSISQVLNMILPVGVVIAIIAALIKFLGPKIQEWFAGLRRF